ncbi:MAG: galactokinase [Planctomycetota bacterium]
MESFLDLLNRLERMVPTGARSLFQDAGEVVVSRAPGRLDVMGGIADYSGALVLELPLKEAALTALVRRPDRFIEIVSLKGSSGGRDLAFRMDLSELEQSDRPLDYETARAFFLRDPGDSWAAYVAGAFLVLMKEHGVRFEEGASLLIRSAVPEGKGVSSSAALEVAAMKAICCAYGISLDAEDLARCCQMVENRVVGAPCGIMDQMTAACGRPDHLLALLCQPAEIQNHIKIPDSIAFFGIESGERHQVSGDDYGGVRTGAFMGYRIIADLAGLPMKAGDSQLSIEDQRFKGYLANISPSLFEQEYEPHLPVRMEGREFLDRYAGITDPVTRVDPDRTYAVRRPAAHPIHEHARVRAFAEMLALPLDPDRLSAMGDLMYQSHASYSACGLGADGTDLLVKLVQVKGPRAGLFGAKITGGGSGGTVAVLAMQDARSAIDEVADRYLSRTGHEPVIFSGSSPSADSFGCLLLMKKG